ncbi:MAG: RagB/SusD family nutrient uptake outer membrane protein [Bacteroides sp.]|nr:RagB/SusD family nutrient uptake outer membrane protein [Bacteroides sp.]
MKSYIKSIFAASIVALTVGSCTDLDVDIKSQLTEYPNSEIALEAKMADVYFSLRADWGRRYHEVMSFSSDEFTGVCFGADDYLDNYNYANPSLHRSSPDDACVGHWTNAASGITKCNDIIMELGGEDAEAAAPALAMRAFYHFILMDSYGDVPLLDHKPDVDEVVERAPRADVARFIESDLLKAIPNLSEANDASTYGKPNRWMAEALLVKLYINWAVYTCGDITKYTPSITNEKLNDCIAHCDNIINSGIFNLDDGYRVKFMPENGVHIKDFIYAMPYDAVTAQGMTYGRFETWRKANSSKDACYYGEILTKSFGGIFAITPEMADLFCLEGDERNEVIIGGEIKMFDPVTREKTETPWLYNGEPVVLSKEIELVSPSIELMVSKDVHGWSQGYRSVKWWISAADYNNHNRNQSNDVPIFRYADVLLTKAEAILRGGSATNGDTAASLMNQVRACAGAPSVSGTPTLQDLLDERGRELFSENWRRNDLIRYGNFEDDWGWKNIINPDAKTNYNARLLPVPTGIMTENTNWKQNPGY